MSIGQGHPDWQTPQVWRDTALVSRFNSSFSPGNNVLGPFTLPHYNGVSIYFNAPSTPLILVITCYADGLATNATANFRWSVQSGAPLSVTIPVTATYIKVTVNNPAGGIATGTLFVQPTNIASPVPLYDTALASQPLIQFAGSIGAAGNATIVGAFTYAGPAALMLHQNTDANHQLNIDYWDEFAQAWQNMAVYLSAVDGQDYNRRIALPPSTVRASLTNNDAAARTFQLAVCAG